MAHSSPQETCCIRYATESQELELDRLHMACTLAEAGRAVQTTAHADASGPVVAAGCESGHAGDSLDHLGEERAGVVERGLDLEENGAAALGLWRPMGDECILWGSGHANKDAWDDSHRCGMAKWCL